MPLVSLWIRNPRSGPGRGTSQAGAGSERRPHIEMMSGSRKRDAVQDSSAVPPRARLEVEFLGADQAYHFGDRLLLKGRCGSALACLGLDIWSWSIRFRRPGPPKDL